MLLSCYCEPEAETHKNPHTNSNNSLKDLSIKLDNNTMPESKVLKHVPNPVIAEYGFNETVEQWSNETRTILEIKPNLFVCEA